MTILESQGGENKKKSLALKASNSHDEESDEEEEDQDFQLLIKKFTKFAKRENLISEKQNKPSKCFECGEIGHIKPNCPKLQKGEKYKKLKKKQKAYMSWENEDDSSTDSDDDEVANICLTANDEKDWGCDHNQFSLRRGFIKNVKLDAKKVLEILRQDGSGLGARLGLDELNVRLSGILVKEVLTEILKIINFEED
ncbi:hypothetical protein PIB30_084407 [Stylosanthes scabra]|uniref:CCHC-type domain-containing protein n=1 Tax=Stylosanthes scabra TaxID=79078 RepID=A0ABU6WSE6_9FABA|nr:hypothetical protein [Stylosanthes scabra]